MSTEHHGGPRGLVELMLGALDPASYSIEGDPHQFTVAMAGVEIVFNAATQIDLAFEQVASAVEAWIAWERSATMMAASGEQSSAPPLWLVVGSDVLARWLAWSGAGNALRRTLVITNQLSAAPVTGMLQRRARHELGQGSARIRVWGGMAVAERIELGGRSACVAMLAQEARIRIEDHALPETYVDGLAESLRLGERKRLADIVDHPFFASADLIVSGVRNDGRAVVFTVENRWTPLAPVPEAALAVVPQDADPVFSWRATAAEIAALDRLVDLGRRYAIIPA